MIAVNERVKKNSSPVSVPAQQETVLIFYIFSGSVFFIIDTTSLSCVIFFKTKEIKNFVSKVLFDLRKPSNSCF